MTHDMAKQFWNLYLGMASKDGAHVNMLSPTEDFKARAHAGEFDTLTDDQVKTSRLIQNKAFILIHIGERLI